MRRAPLPLHRYVYLITLDRAGSTWTMSTQRNGGPVAWRLLEATTEQCWS